MLLILMYHRINDPVTGANVDSFKKHLVQLKNNFPIVSPGEKLAKGKTSLCLTFDDGYYDFYKNVFPLLKSLHIPATLAVPTQFILDRTELDSKIRLSIPYPYEMTEDYFRTHGCFCTWEELKEMSDTNLVNIASHSHSHPHMDNNHFDFKKEVITSKETIELKVNKPVNTFVYPFGDINRKIHKRIRQHYQYNMRIGSASNKDWAKGYGLLYRIDAEPLWKHGLMLTPQLLKKFHRKFLLNRLRFK